MELTRYIQLRIVLMALSRLIVMSIARLIVEGTYRCIINSPPAIRVIISDHVRRLLCLGCANIFSRVKSAKGFQLHVALHNCQTAL